MKVKEESEKADLKFNIENMKIMTSIPITSWEINGEKWKQWQILYSWAPKSLWTVTVAMKKLLLLRRKTLTNLDSIFRSRGIAFLTESPFVKVMIFMYGSENWTIEKASHQRIDDFKLWC